MTEDSGLMLLFYIGYCAPACVTLIYFAILLASDDGVVLGDVLDAALWTFIPCLNIFAAITGWRFAWPELRAGFEEAFRWPPI